MLTFNRPSFRSGVIIVKEPDGESGTLSYEFHPSDKGQQFTFHSDEYVLAHYAACFTAPG